MLLSVAAFASEPQGPAKNLDFLKDREEYQKIQREIGWAMRAQYEAFIKENVSMMDPNYNRMLTFVRTMRAPEIIGYEYEVKEREDVNPDATGKKKKKFDPSALYFVWGYNRAWHSNSDMTFTTQNGTFTVHDAQGVDRPSPFDFNTYFNPAKLSIPQYVVKVGYMFNEKIGIELAQDHMKWVFENEHQYEVTGDYDQTVYTNVEGEEWPVAMDFDDVKETGNMTWLAAEHSDGYNYVNVSVLMNIPIIKTKNEIFELSFRPNVGVGLMVPKTRIFMHQGSMWDWQGLDNRFHVAGYGAHAEVKLRATFWNRFFIESALRGTYIKIENSLVNGSDDRLEQTPIGSLQFYGAAGFFLPIGKNNRWKRKKKPNL